MTPQGYNGAHFHYLILVWKRIGVDNYAARGLVLRETESQLFKRVGMFEGSSEFLEEALSDFIWDIQTVVVI